MQIYFPVIKGGIRLDTENFSFRASQKLRVFHFLPSILIKSLAMHSFSWIIIVFLSLKMLKNAGTEYLNRKFYEFLQKLHDFIITAVFNESRPATFRSLICGFGVGIWLPSLAFGWSMAQFYIQLAYKAILSFTLMI